MNRKRTSSSDDDGEQTTGATSSVGASKPPPGDAEPQKAIEQYLAYVVALDDPGQDASKLWTLPPLNPNLLDPNR